MRPHGRASVDPRRPRAFGICDRCGCLYNLARLRYQYDWRGDELVNTRFKVCPPCLDKPFEGRRPLVLPPDPLPVDDPRIERYLIDETENPYIPPLPPIPPIPTINAYVAEDGVTEYTAEDGTTVYVQE